MQGITQLAEQTSCYFGVLSDPFVGIYCYFLVLLSGTWLDADICLLSIFGRLSA